MVIIMNFSFQRALNLLDFWICWTLSWVTFEKISSPLPPSHALYVSLIKKTFSSYKSLTANLTGIGTFCLYFFPFWHDLQLLTEFSCSSAWLYLVSALIFCDNWRLLGMRLHAATPEMDLVDLFKFILLVFSFFLIFYNIWGNPLEVC